MTSEEAIERIKEHKVIHKMNEPRAIYISEALDMAIKALEQESKTAHWIRVIDKSKHSVWECPKCSWQQQRYTNYCPKCGANLENKRYKQGYKDGYTQGFTEGVILG